MPTLLIIVVGCVAALVATRRGLTRREVQYARAAFLLHVVSSFAQTALQDSFYEGVSDDNGYLRAGALMARLLVSDFARFAPDVLRVAVHLDSTTAMPVYGTASSHTMEALGGVYVYCFGPALLNACLVTGMLSWYGQLCLFRTARAALARSEHNVAAIGCLFVPSAVFWGSAFEKEALVLAAIGLLTWSAFELLRAPKVANVVGVGVGVIAIGLVKPYILFPYLLAMSAWLYVSRAGRQDQPIEIRPRYLLLALLAACGGVAVLGAIFPQFGVDRLSESVVRQQDAWQFVQGGSNIDTSASGPIGLAQQLPFIPIAFINALFRPALFEVRNPAMLAAALETTAVSVLVVVLLVQYAWRQSLQIVLGSPPLAFAVTFVLVLSVAVGLTTRNLGSLSRYRVPMMPFLTTALLVLHRRVRAT